MFTRFFSDLRTAGVPVSLREYLAFPSALDAQVVLFDAEDFYYLARAVLVKDERHFDRFDRVFLPRSAVSRRFPPMRFWSRSICRATGCGSWQRRI